jgi:hypothetical protein
MVIAFCFMDRMNTQSKVLVWNCRGAASTSFYRYCNQYVVSHKPDILVIMETRCDPEKLRNTFCLMGFDGFEASAGSGYVGGIVLVWKKDSVYVEPLYKKFQYMHVKVKCKHGGEWFFTPVYASPNEENRRILWEELHQFSRTINDGWMLAGDFNDIASINEKKGGIPASSRKCAKFVDRINRCQLMDLGATGSKFTWRGPLYAGAWIFERLYRALSNDSWRISFPEAIVKVLPRLDFSDHHPILISLFRHFHVGGARAFRFESAWQLDKSYNDMLAACWDKNRHVHDNLQALQHNIKEWKFLSFDTVIERKKELMARIGGIQKSMYTGGNLRWLRGLEKKLQSELAEILKKEEIMWFQRSRAKWLMDGDRNTRYYHLKTIN